MPTVTEAFDSGEVLKAMYRFPRAVAAGGSGLSPAHLNELLSVPCTNEASGILAGLSKLLKNISRGKEPSGIAAWISGAPLTELKKKCGGVRPISVGETLLRMVRAILMARVSEEAKKYLEPTQVGVATKGGTDPIVHASRKLIDLLGSEN